MEMDAATESKHPRLRWFFLRGLGIIYLIAFASLIPQWQGLWGAQGILPIEQFLPLAKNALPPPQCYLTFPSLFWLGVSDNAIGGLVTAGCLASLCAAVGLLPGISFIVCWVLYLSIVAVGQDFLSFQWDSLLIEVGFLAMFMAPWVVLDKPRGSLLPRSVIFMWMTRWLLFKLMLLSGLVKLASGDPTWRNATALDYHYETQPLPLPSAWFVHQLPSGVDTFCTVIMFVIELVIPFFMFGPPKARKMAAVATIMLQLGIMFTGNYTFFNILTCLLCISLFDREPLPRLGHNKLKYPWLPAAVAISIFAISLEEIVAEFTENTAISAAAEQVISSIQPFRIVNNYGLFRVMTTTRDEITIEGSNDGVDWKPYVFPFKPGPLDRGLPIVAPYQPRLDWQMWFASLGTAQRNPWFYMLCRRVMEGSKPVLFLFEKNPFADAPPRFLRATIATYHFTTPEERQKTGNWWRADPPTLYLPTVERQIVE